MSKRTVFICACLLSLLIHALAAWVLFDPTWLVGAPATMAMEVFDAPIVDLTQPANRIRPAHAKVVGVEHNATTQETVAVHRPPAAQTRGQAPTTARSAPRQPTPPVHASLPTVAMREPQAPHQKLPATAVVETLGMGLGLPLPEDYFPDYQHGGHTYLNVIKRPGVDYFVQLKRILKLAWDPAPAIRSHRNEVSAGGMRVVIAITLDRQGNLTEHFILRGSGMSAYDHEALRATVASAPFSSPSPNLLAADGTLRMSWTFIFYL